MSYIIISGDSVDKAIDEGLKKLNTTRDQVEVEIVQAPSKGFLGLIGSKEATVKLTEKVNTKDLVREILQDQALEDIEESEEPVEEPKIEQNQSTKGSEEAKKEESTPYVEEKFVEENTEEPSLIEKEELKDVDSYKKDDPDKIQIIEDFADRVSSVLGLETQTKIDQQKDHIDVEILGDEKKLGLLIGKRGATLDAVQYLMTRLVNQDQEGYTRVFLDTSNYRDKREKTLESLARKSANKVLKTGRNVRLEPMNAAERRIIHGALQDVDGVMTQSEGKDPHRRVVIQQQGNDA